MGKLVVESDGAQDNFKGVLIVEINGSPVRSLKDIKENLQGDLIAYVWYLGNTDLFLEYQYPLKLLRFSNCQPK